MSDILTVFAKTVIYIIYTVFKLVNIYAVLDGKLGLTNLKFCLIPIICTYMEWEVKSQNRNHIKHKNDLFNEKLNSGTCWNSMCVCISSI